MARIISRCIMCGGFFDSRKQLREHIDRHHRITNSKIAAVAARKEWLMKKEEEKQKEMEEEMPTILDSYFLKKNPHYK